MSSFLALTFEAFLLLVRGTLSLAAPALALLLFAFPPAAPLDFLTSAPVVCTILLLALAALADFCADLWRLQTAQQSDRHIASALTGLGSVAEGLIRLERSARWRQVRRRGEWLFVPLWLAAALWIHDEAAVPMVAGALSGSVILLFFASLARLDAERRERRIADSALRAASSLGLARLLGRFAAFSERSLARHRSARRAERSLAVLSATCLLCVRLSAAATLVLFLLYALSLTGGGRTSGSPLGAKTSMGELVAILLLLRSVFFWLEQRARALTFYAPKERRGIVLASTSEQKQEQEQEEGETESADASILRIRQGEVLSASQAVLACDALVLRRGEAVALAGESASGKSLLLQACAGMVESKGFFLSGKALDGGSVEGEEGAWYLPQEAALLEGSLGENIAGFQTMCDEARATELLVRLGAERVLARLPDGLATRAAPFDARLPHAFKVQVLVAAALYSESKLLLCDACIDALDGKGIERFARAMQTFCKEGGAAVLTTRQSVLLGLCRRAWICAQNRVQVRELGGGED